MFQVVTRCDARLQQKFTYIIAFPYPIPAWAGKCNNLDVYLIIVLLLQDPLNPADTVIVIRSLVPGGVAQLDGSLVPGDRLMAVNEVHFSHF